MQEFATGKAVCSTALHQLTCLLKSRKAVRIMKLTGILLLAGCLQLSARGLSQTISISVKDAPLLSVLKAIEKQTEYVFFVNGKDLQKANKISLTVNNIPFQQVLDLCFKNQPLTYAITGKVITVSPKAEKAGHNTANALNEAPPQTIRGKIVNENGDPVLASVIVKGGSQGTTTNENGEFTLTGVPDNAVLVISGVGLETKEIKLSGSSAPLYVTVKISVAPLDETIVQAYGTTTRKFKTGNISKVSGTDIQKQPIGDPILALQGRVPGLQISQYSGTPGAIMNINLRGINSIANSNNPMFIIDGIQFPSNTLTNNGLGGATSISPFSSIDMSNIESIEVLKDADATAIYGSRGANGVILITTKKGHAGKMKITVDFSAGAGKVSRMMDLLNTQQYLEIRHEALRNDGISTPSVTDYDINGTWDTTRYTDWQKMIIGNTAHITNAQLSMSGGTSLTQYIIGGNYRKETTIFPGNHADQKYSVHSKINSSSENRKLNVQLSANYLIDNNQLPVEDLTKYIYLAPDAPLPFNKDGSLNFENNTIINNPFAFTLRKTNPVTKNLVGTLNISYMVLPGLKVKADLGYNNIKMDQDLTMPLMSYTPALSSNTSLRTHRFGTNEIKTWNAEPQITYDRKISKGNLNILLGSTFQETINQSISQIASNFSSDALIDNIAAASSISIIGLNYTQYRYNALFGRLSYNWDERYLVNLTGRRDGSTRFGPGKQFGNFGAVGLGWIFSNEKLIKNNLSFLSYGKLRASYGTTGNDQLTDYDYLSTYSVVSNTYLGATGLFPTKLANSDYGWEMVKKLELGLEFGFINNRILLSSSYYRNRTDNQLVGYPLPTITGANNVRANLPAVIQNTGLEFELNSTNFKRRDFTWSTSFNISFPRNKLVDFPNLKATSYAIQYEVGQPLYLSRRLHSLGVDQQTGIYTYQDINGDGFITLSQDRVGLKQRAQKYYGSLENNFSYKGLSLSFSFYYVKQTGLVYLWNSTPGIINANQPTSVLDRWQKPGQVTDVQKLTQNFGNTVQTALSNYQNSDAQIEDASFIRFRNLNISYSIPAKLKQKLGLSDSKIYLQAENLFTITNYRGLDPETQSLLLLPPLRMITAGIQISF